MIKKIDAVTILDHHYLTSSDSCYYFGEYTSGTGFAHSPTNNLISNFKKPISVKGTAQWPYKERAIKQVISLLKGVKYPNPENIIFVPIPPSKTVQNPNYDDRITQVLTGACPDLNIEYKELIMVKEDMDAFHQSATARLSPKQLIGKLEINEVLADNIKPIIFLIDDVITTGSHFKACKELLLNRFPEVKVGGIFVARRNFEQTSTI